MYPLHRLTQLALAGTLALLCLTPALATGPVPTASERAEAVTYPLSPDDPAARLDPDLLHLPPVPTPARAGTMDVAGFGEQGGEAEAAYRIDTGEFTVRGAATAKSLPDPSKRPKPRALLSPAYAGPEWGIQKVIGEDERLLISPTTQYPWRVQCKLFITFPSGAQYIGSGTLVSHRHVLTAAHCVWNTEEGGWAYSIEVVPGLDGTYKPFGSAWATHFRSFVGYTDFDDSNHDIALITLDRNIGNTTGWFGYGYWQSLVGAPAHIAGYPGDLEDGLRQYYGYGPIEAETEYQLEYRIDTAGGQSGSGVFLVLDGVPYVCAAHAWGTSSTNGGTRITETKFNLIQGWIQSDL